MKFWDSSAVIPLCVEENQSRHVLEIARKDAALAVWWGTPVECYSAFARMMREGDLSESEERQVLSILAELERSWTEVEPSDEIRDITRRLLQNYQLRVADSLQLAAAIIWANKSPKGHPFVCLDERLRAAASKEGFEILPTRL